MARMDCPLETPNPVWSFPFYLDVGLYWYSRAGECIRHVPGEANPFFDPGARTVIYVHGWQKTTTIRGFRETFHWKANAPAHGLDVDVAAAWLDDGWNVGIFYWNQYADEPALRHAEAKIWTASSKVGMRWRRLVVEMDGPVPMRKTVHASSPPSTPSVAHLLCQAYIALYAAADDATPPTPSDIRLVGHSLGAQVVVAAAHELHHQAAAGALPNWLPLPTRVTLLDPVFTPGKKSYLGRRSIGTTLRRLVDALARYGLAVESIKYSKVNELWSGSDRSKRVRLHAAHVDMRSDPASIPKHAITHRHSSAPSHYFFAYAPRRPSEHALEEVVEKRRGLLGKKSYATVGPWYPLPRRSHAEIREMMDSMYRWKQISAHSWLRTEHAS